MLLSIAQVFLACSFVAPFRAARKSFMKLMYLPFAMPLLITDPKKG
jgi:hypothetical protein